MGQEESHLVHTRTSSFALFALESFNFDLFDLDVGGRLESVNLKNTSLERGFFPGAFSSTIKREILRIILFLLDLILLKEHLMQLNYLLMVHITH